MELYGTIRMENEVKQLRKFALKYFVVSGERA